MSKDNCYHENHGHRFQMRSVMTAPINTPIYGFPNHASITGTTWFEQWSNAIMPDFNARVRIAMRRVNMRTQIIELINEAKTVSKRSFER